MNLNTPIGVGSPSRANNAERAGSSSNAASAQSTSARTAPPLNNQLPLNDIPAGRPNDAGNAPNEFTVNRESLARRLVDASIPTVGASISGGVVGLAAGLISNGNEPSRQALELAVGVGAGVGAVVGVGTAGVRDFFGTPSNFGTPRNDVDPTGHPSEPARPQIEIDFMTLPMSNRKLEDLEGKECPITQEPYSRNSSRGDGNIENPVQWGESVFECNSLVTWLNQNPTHPTTREEFNDTSVILRLPTNNMADV